MSLTFSISDIPHRRRPHALDRPPASNEPRVAQKEVIAKNILLGLSDDLRLGNRETLRSREKAVKLIGREACILSEIEGGDFSKAITLVITYANLLAAKIDRDSPHMQKVRELAEKALENTNPLAAVTTPDVAKENYWKAAEDTSPEHSFAEALDLITAEEEALTLQRKKQKEKEDLLAMRGDFADAPTAMAPPMTDELIDQVEQSKLKDHSL